MRSEPHAGHWRLTGCDECGALQAAPALPGGAVLTCAVCESTLERSHGRSLAAALAFAVAGLLLLIAANLEPFLGTSIFGVARQSWMISSASAMLSNGLPELAIAIGLFSVALPLVHLGLLTAVLGTLQTRRRPQWLGPAFRLANALQTWAMLDVFLLGCVVAVARLRTELTVVLDLGAYCFLGAAILSLLVRATLDTDAAWRAIAADAADRSEVGTAPSLCCNVCKLVVPADREATPCPRCRATLHRRKPGAMRRTVALTFAAAVLYLPANLYPMATLPIGFTPTTYTVIEGVLDLIDARLYGLGLLVLVASFAIPLGKLLGLAWCVLSVLQRSDRRLRAKTRVFRMIEEIGRWSMVDPFVIACFVPITNFNALIYGRAGPAAPAFAAVVVLTTLAAHSFDPRLMWDAAQPRKPS